MGIGKLGGSQLIFKRKFRWTFRCEDLCTDNGSTGVVEEHFVKIASRPSLTVEESEINFLNAKTWIPGKASWETMSITYYDVATNDNRSLWNWLASVYEFTDPVNLKQASQRRDYAGRGVLQMYDGCGNVLEVWTLNDMWPTAINFGELDYSNNEESTIELTLRYSSVDYKSVCPDFTPTSCCSPCGGTSGGTVLGTV